MWKFVKTANQESIRAAQVKPAVITAYQASTKRVRVRPVAEGPAKRVNTAWESAFARRATNIDLLKDLMFVTTAMLVPK